MITATFTDSHHGETEMALISIRVLTHNKPSTRFRWEPIGGERVTTGFKSIGFASMIEGVAAAGDHALFSAVADIL